MTAEEKLKELILSRYQSIREFTIAIDIAYSTFDTIMKRGIRNANVSNVIKICNALHISADALADGEIATVTFVSNEINTAPLQFETVIKDFKTYLLSHDLTIDGKALNPEIVNEFNRYLDFGLDTMKRHIK